jgi:hypothetical protein
MTPLVEVEFLDLGLGNAGDALVAEYDEAVLHALKERDDFI